MTYRLDRRRFLHSMTALAAASSTGAFAQGTGKAPNRFRTMTFNIGKALGFPEAKARMAVPDTRRAMPLKFAETLRRYSPDVITMCQAPSEEIVREMANSLGMKMTYITGPGDSHGAILSRYELRDFRVCPIEGGRRPELLFTRGWGAATVSTPLGNVRIHSIELNQKDAEARGIELDEMLSVVKADLKSSGSVLVQGDFFGGPNSPEFKKLEAAGLTDTFAKKGQGPGESFPSERPTRRSDIIWIQGSLGEKLIESRVLSEIPFRRDGRDAKSYALSEHLPVMATFGSAG